MKKKPILTVPPFWIGIIVSCFGVIIFSIILLSNIEMPRFPILEPKHFIIILLLFIPTWLVRYELYEKYLLVKWTIIPIRKIPWEHFSGATYIPDNINGIKIKRGASIMLTVFPCNPYRYSTDYVLFGNNASRIIYYEWLHLRKSIRIWITEGQEEAFVKTIKDCVGVEKCYQMPDRNLDD